MKYRVQEFRRKQCGQVYTYYWLGYSYRNEKGTPTFKYLCNITPLPENIRRNISKCVETDEEVYINKDIEFFKATPIGAEAVCWKLAEDLGIVDALSELSKRDLKLVMSMVIDRVVEATPHTRKSLFETLDRSSLERVCGLDSESVCADQFYSALEHLYDIQMFAEKKLFESNENGDKRFFLYDITSSYFEGDSCPLAPYGYNRDDKQGKQQLVIGMLTDNQGFPVSVRDFKGDTQEQTTVMERIDSLRKDFGIDEFVFVGDRAMLTRARRKDLTAKEYNKIKYISALPESELIQLIEDANHPLQLSLFDRSRLVEVEHDGIKYVLSFNPELEEESRKTRLRLIEMTEEKLKCIEKNVRNGSLCTEQAIIKRLYSWLNRWDSARFFNVEFGERKFTWSKKEEVIKSYEAMDGFYVLTTDCVELTAEEVREKYSCLQQVEQTFRTLKTTELFVRPNRMWEEKRVRGYIFLCMLSYMIIWKARRLFADFIKPEDEHRNSLRDIWDELRNVQIGRISLEGKIHEQLSTIERRTKRILDVVGLNQETLKNKYLKV